MYRFVLFACTFLSGLCCLAAENRLAGTVKNNQGQPVPAATVSLLRAADSSWLASVLTDERGGFVFVSSPPAPCFLQVTAHGYRPERKEVTVDREMEIVLSPAGQVLEEVVVKSKAPAIRTELGKTVLNFDQVDAGAGNTVLDLLRRSPGVTVSGNGGISMNGKGVLVMINDKQSYLSGEDLANYLRTLSADQVAQLELISEPSARYEAEGTAGIINIRTRTSPAGGLQGSLSGSYGQTRYWNTHNNGALHYRKGRTTVYLLAGYLHATGFLEQELSRTTVDGKTGRLSSRARQDTYMKETFEDYSLTAGVEYELKKQLTIGGSLQAIHHPNRETDRTWTDLTDLRTGAISYNSSVNDHGFERQRGHGNLFARYGTKERGQIVADLDYLLWNQRELHQITALNYDAGMNPTADSFRLRGDVPINMQVYVGKADYTRTFGKELTVEAGIRSSYLSMATDVRFDIRRDNEWQYDTSRSNDYRYRERIDAAYVSASAHLGTRWKARAGLRLEHTEIEGLQVTQDQRFDKQFTSLFPGLVVSYKLDEAHSLELDCGRRISRPSYRNLNPFRVYLSQYSYRAGNPDLLPEYRNRASLRHNYRNRVLSELTYSRVYNVVSPVISFDEASRVVYETLINYANRHNVHLSVSCNRELRPWWQLSLSYDYYFNEYRDSAGRFLVSSHGHSGRLGNELSYRGWNMNLYWTYNSGDRQSLTEINRPSQWLSGSLSKSLLKDTTVVRFSFEDPLNLYRQQLLTEWNGVYTDERNAYASQGVSVGLTYRFGRNQELRQRERNVEEAGRM